MRCERRSRLRAQRHARCQHRLGFTLVELLVVVVIVGVLTALLLPAVQAARESSRRSHCQNNLRQLGVAVSLYANSHQVFPIGCLGGPRSNEPRMISWNVQILPFMEQSTLADKFEFALPAFHPDNLLIGSQVVATFLCPSTTEPELAVATGTWRGAAFTDYSGVYGVEGAGRDRPAEEMTERPAEEMTESVQTLRDDSLGLMLYDVAVAPKQIVDGISRTACIAEISGRRTYDSAWINGRNIFAQEQATPINGIGLGKEIGSPHPRGALVAFADARVEFLEETIEQSILNAMLTKAGGE